MTRSKERKYLSLKNQKKAQLQGDRPEPDSPAQQPSRPCPIGTRQSLPLQAMSSLGVDGAITAQFKKLLMPVHKHLHLLLVITCE